MKKTAVSCETTVFSFSFSISISVSVSVSVLPFCRSAAYSAFGTGILATRRSWRPPSNSAAKKASSILTASSLVMKRAGKTMTLASLWRRSRRGRRPAGSRPPRSPRPADVHSRDSRRSPASRCRNPAPRNPWRRGIPPEIPSFRSPHGRRRCRSCSCPVRVLMMPQI